MEEHAMDIEGALLQYIRTNLVFGREQAQFSANEPLFGGSLDSLGVLRLVIFIEEQFQISVQDQELVPENFETVQHIARYIRERATASA